MGLCFGTWRRKGAAEAALCGLELTGLRRKWGKEHLGVAVQRIDLPPALSKLGTRDPATFLALTLLLRAGKGSVS